MWDWTESRIACSWHSGSPFNSHQLSSKNLAGSRQIHFLDSILFPNSQCNQTWEGWVWSANATSVLSRPPKRLILDFILDILQLSELNPFDQNARRHHEHYLSSPHLFSAFPAVGRWKLSGTGTWSTVSKSRSCWTRTPADAWNWFFNFPSFLRNICAGMGPYAISRWNPK